MTPAGIVRHGVVILPEHPWRRAQQMWRRAEELGFDHVWTYDHLMWRWLRDEPWFGCLPTLAAAATATSRIRLGMLVASPGFRHPVPFAKELMTLDDISDGRLVAGIGSGAGGYDEQVLGPSGPPPSARAERFDEFVRLTDSLLRNAVTDFTGRHFSAREAHMRPGCRQRPRVPFALAATGPRAMRLAARHADVWVTAGPPGRFDAVTVDQALPGLAEQVARMEDACLAEGRDPAGIDRLVLTGAMVGGVLDSPEAYRDAEGRLGEIGFTDMVVHWPRHEPPYAGDPDVLEAVAPHTRSLR